MFTVRDALQMDSLKEATLLAGRSGLDQEVGCVDISETPDSNEWLRPKEFLITTGYSIRGDLSKQMALVQSLANVGGAALAIKFGRFIGDIPQEMVELADQVNLPLLSLPNNVPFIDITYPIMQRIVNEQAQDLEYSEAVYETLTKIALETNSTEEISQAIEKLIHKKARIYPYVLTQQAIHQLVGWQLFPIQVKHVTYGYLAIQSQVALSKREIVTVRHASVIVALQLMSYRLAAESGWNERRDLLDDLISGRFTNYDLVQLRAQEFGFSLKGEKELAIFNVDNFASYLLQKQVSERQAVALRRDLFRCIQRLILQTQAGNRNFLTAQQNDKIILLCSAHVISWKKIIPEIREQIFHLEPSLTVTIGISEAIHKIEEIPQAYKTANHLIYLSRKLYGPGHTLSEKDAELYLILEQIDHKAIFEDTFRDIIQSKHAKAYFLTLQTYLECQGNHSQTAAILFIHRNTLRYRLQQIQKLLGRNLDDPETRVFLWLLLKGRKLHYS